VRGFLVDTNVLSEARKGARPDARVVAWIRAYRERLYLSLSVLVTGEVRRGIETIRRRDRTAATALERWLREVETDFEDRILPIDSAVADRWGRLAAGRPVSTIDGLLAATALVHGLALATRNVRDMAPTGVPCVNPFDVELTRGADGRIRMGCRRPPAPPGRREPRRANRRRVPHRHGRLHPGTGRAGR